ncbi:MAG: hypothetical protein R6X34_13525 [Chloroflexota bacterium]
MVFDLDGTLVQTERLKAISYAWAARILHPELEETAVIAAFKDVVGLSRREVALGLMTRFGLTDYCFIVSRFGLLAYNQIAASSCSLHFFELSDHDTFRQSPFIEHQTVRSCNAGKFS